ncbi:ATP-binding protein [Actinomadura keratinilytica]
MVYRVAQEAFTNTVRHAGAARLELRLARSRRGVELRIRDDGRGVGDSPEGAGLRGMRERALLIGAGLAVGRPPGGGTEIRLTVPTCLPAPAERPRDRSRARRPTSPALPDTSDGSP